MIRIKDYILNENEIVYIEEFDAQSLGIMFKGKDKAIFVDAHPEDIEWNYGTDCYEDFVKDLNRQLDRLEEKNKKSKNDIKLLLKENEKKEKVIKKQKEIFNKAIEYLEHEQFRRIMLGFSKDKYLEKIKEKTIKILKGE